MPEAPNQTPMPGTGDQTPTGTDPSTSPGNGTPQPSPIDYYQKFTDSSREAQRLYQENLRLQGLLQAAQTPPLTPAKAADDLYGEFSDAVIDRKPEGIRKFAASIRDEVIGDMSKNLSKQQRMQASLTFVQNELRDPNSAMARQTMERYGQIATDPSYGWVEPETITVGNVPINPHLLRLAAIETKARLGTSLTATDAAARNTPDSFVEPATPAAVRDKNKFDPQIHLSEEERAAARDRKMSYDTYWKYLDDPKKQSLREARLKAGKPLKYHQL